MTKEEQEFRKQLHVALARNINMDKTSYVQATNFAVNYVQHVTEQERQKGAFDKGDKPCMM